MRKSLMILLSGCVGLSCVYLLIQKSEVPIQARQQPVSRSESPERAEHEQQPQPEAPLQAQGMALEQDPLESVTHTESITEETAAAFEMPGQPAAKPETARVQNEDEVTSNPGAGPVVKPASEPAIESMPVAAPVLPQASPEPAIHVQVLLPPPAIQAREVASPTTPTAVPEEVTPTDAPDAVAAHAALGPDESTAAESLTAEQEVLARRALHSEMNKAPLPTAEVKPGGLANALKRDFLGRRGRDMFSIGE